MNVRSVLGPKEFLSDSDLVLPVVKDGKIIAATRASHSLSHAEFVRRELGWTPETLPAGVEVVSIGKHEGVIGALRSVGFHKKTSLPASAAAQTAARARYR